LKRIGVSVSKEIYKKIKIRAVIEDKTISELLVGFIEEALKSKK